MTALRVAVAVSGGRDSTALLHCTVRAAATLGITVVALHVHHGLVAAAASWLAQVRQQSRRWGAEFAFRRLQDRPVTGQSVEAWARAQRYAALAEMAHEAGCTLVLLAHHRRDQAETWLLQGLRGGSPAGLAAMPQQALREGVVWARPWLGMPRAAIEAYVQRHRLAYVDDTSNADPRFARNRLRLQVWPALQGAFGDAEVALTRAAARAHEAAALAAEVAALDLGAIVDGATLVVAPWLALTPARRSNALRVWLARVLGASAPETLVQRLLRELPATPAGRWPAGGAELRLYQGRLQAREAELDPPAGLPCPIPLDLSSVGEVALAPWCGSFRVTAATAGGACAQTLRSLVARPRSGGERFCLAPQGVPRSLKQQYQARAVPAWDRGGPLLFSPAGRLVYAPALGFDARFVCEPGQPQLQLIWVPATTGG